MKKTASKPGELSSMAKYTTAALNTPASALQHTQPRLFQKFQENAVPRDVGAEAVWPLGVIASQQ